MPNRFRVSSTLPRRLQELGLSPEAVLRQAGLPMGLLNQEKILVSTEEFFALHQGIAEARNDPGFGLKLGTEERVEHYGLPVGSASWRARSLWRNLSPATDPRLTPQRLLMILPRDYAR